MSRIVTSQAELDQALADGATGIVIDSPAGVWIDITAGYVAEVRGESTVGRVSGSGRVGRVSGSGTVEWVSGSGRVGRVSDSGRVGRVSGSGTVEWVSDSGTVGAVFGSGRVGEVSGSGRVGHVYDSGRVERVSGSGRVGRVSDSGRVEWVSDSGSVGQVYGSGRVGQVYGSGRVEHVYGSGRVEQVSGSGRVGRVSGSGRVGQVYGSGRVEWVSDSGSVEHATGTATIHLYGGTLGKAAPHVAVFVHTANSTWTGGTLIDLRDLDLTDPQTWCDHHGVTVTDGIATLYKAVNDQWTTDRGWDYSPGSTPEAPDWADTDACGRGLHFGPSPAHAKDYYDEATRFVAVGVRLDELRPIIGSGTAKAKAKRVVRPCVEVDIAGREVSR